MTISRDVLERLRTEGWRKYGTGGTTYGPNCLLGAYRAVTRTPMFYDLMTDEQKTAELAWRDPLVEIIREQYGPDIKHIPEFNDLTWTTFADIELVLEKAAVREEERV